MQFAGRRTNVCVDSNDGFNQGFAAHAKPFD
jgi:hypothetical protein